MRRIAAVLAVLLLPAICRADRDILFSAQWYEWADIDRKGDGKPERCLVEKGPYHIYRIDPDGSGRKQITSGKRDDVMPSWSPDGMQILFAREQPKARLAISLVGADGGAVKTLLTVEDDYRYYGSAAWSPDGRWIALLRTGRPGLVVVEARTGRQHLVPFGDRFAWSPDSKRLFVDFASEIHRAERAEVWSFAGEKPRCISRLKTGVWNPCWLDNETVVGDKPDPKDYDLTMLRIISARGSVFRNVKLKPWRKLTRRERDNGMYELAVERRHWSRIPGTPKMLLLEAGDGHSDGYHFATYRVSLDSGIYTPIRSGSLIGVSPDGRRCAVADRRWEGGYKQTGQRCGPLEIVDLRTGKARAITPKLGSTAGGDWRALHTPSPRGT